ncbi:AAA family ATPase [uncultured Granulicatella sp.]|uniref:AAA family ATPase n=1 Tax=uncultured Granulicatella sp. TaxID=316089 RepID=UPI0028D17115|nr:AAA family ATPase [uncultured Granulicatella sp.]
MLEQIKGIKLKGANFVNQTELKLFNSTNDKVAKVALVYGRNGSGKSTISNAFKKVKGEDILNIETASLYDNDSHEISIGESGDKAIFVFNEDFVNDKVKIQEEGLGSIIMLGEKADLTVKIEQATEQLSEAKDIQVEIKQKIEEYRDVTNLKSPYYYKEKMCMTLKNDDGWAGRERRIKESRRNANVPKDKYLEFVNITASKSRLELLIDFEEQMRELEKAKQGSGKIIEEIIKISDEYINFNYSAISKLLEETMEKPLLSEREKYLLKLVETGEKDFLQKQLDYFDNDEVQYCPFCLQDISDDYKVDLVAKIQSILSDFVKEHCRKLSEFLLEEINFDFTSFIQLSSHPESCELLNKLNKTIQENNRVINQKINSPYTSTYEKITDITSLLIELEKSLKNLEEERDEYNKNVVNTKPIIDRLVSINNEIAYYDIGDDYKRYLAQYSEYEKLSTEEQNANKLVDEKLSLCKKLEAERKNIDIAVDLINKGLKYIFFSKERLEIIVENDKYKLLSNGKPVLPSNISVGERNIIGLCYFFASMLQGKDDKNAFKDEYLIIVDDPVSSYDFENKIGILSFLKLKLSQFLNGNLNSKAIILTHDLLTFFDIEKILEELQKEFNDSYGKNKTVFNLFELKKCNLIEFQYKKRHEYTEMMKMIYDYSMEGCSDNSILIGNIMRQVLEAFSTFEYKKGISEVSTDKSIINKLDDEYQSYFSNLMYRLILNGGSHKEEETRSGRLDFFTVISDEEKVRTAKDILCFIYLLNNLHVIAHLGDVSEELNKWCSEIKNN